MIIGLSGTFAAGKDVLANNLQDKFGLMHMSTGDIVREIAQMEKGSTERPVLQEVATELRQTYGGGILVQRAIDRYHNSIRTYAGVVITGIRSLGEAKEVKALDGKLVFIDAPIELRYQRMQERQRDQEAGLSFEEFKQREKKELNSGLSDADFNISKLKEIADITLENSGTLEDFYAQAEKSLQLV